MRKSLFLALLATLFLCGPAHAAEETTSYGRFGRITLYHEKPVSSSVVLFVSGDGGWNLGVVDMARELASMDALVVGVDITHYLKELAASGEKCSYPASDFEELSKFVQKKLGFPEYVRPVLVGYSSGATLVYAVIVQSPPNTFAGAVSMGFCPDLPLTKPLCKGSGLEWTAGPHGKGYSFLPAGELKTPWIAFQGTIDQVCDAKTVEAYVKQVGGAELVLLPKVGHGFSVPRNWMPQFRKAFSSLAGKSPQARAGVAEEVSGLPLIEVEPLGEETDYMAVIVTGDGGWAGIDREIGGTLAARGVRVVGLNSLDYFWSGKDPQTASRDMARILSYYLAKWDKKDALIIGYSLGADVLPFMAAGLPDTLREKVGLVALLGPSRKAEFEFHLTYWLGGDGDEGYPILPELEKLKGMRMICFYGEEEKDSLCTEIPSGLAKVVKLKGAHHFGGDYRTIADAILDYYRLR